MRALIPVCGQQPLDLSSYDLSSVYKQSNRNSVQWFKEWAAHGVVSDFCNLMDYGPLGSSVPGISPARSGLPFPPPGDLPNRGIKPVSPALAGSFFTTEPPGEAPIENYMKLTGSLTQIMGSLKLTQCRKSSIDQFKKKKVKEVIRWAFS